MPDPTIDQALRAARAHQQSGRFGSAEDIYRRVLGQYPNHREALVSLASLLLDSGRLPDSTRVFQQVVALWPDDPMGCMTLGYLYHVQGALNDAAMIYYRLLRAFPASDEILNRLGNVERSRGNRGAAIDLFRRATAARPGFWEARNNLGMTLEEVGQPEEAVRELEEALRIDSHHAEVHYNLAISLATLGRLEDASSSYRRAVHLNPGFAEAFNNLGATLKLLGRLDESGDAFRAALEIRPDWATALSNLAGVYEWQARHDDALACHRRAIAIMPADAGAHGNYLYTLLFHPAYDAEALRVEHAEWNRRHAEPLGRAVVPHSNDRNPGRRLRIGYVGSLFRDHVVGRNLLPLLREHDAAAVEVICYSNNRINDSTTLQFRQLAAGWREIGGLSDVQAEALIRRDRIDILIDTTLHMEGSRLQLFARRPAPLQVTFAGYPGSTGLSAIDYRLTDVHLDPPDAHDDLYAEKSWRLPATFWCYDPLGLDIPVGPLPADANGWITFGSFNNFSKVNDRVLELWAQVLLTVAGSRMLVLCHEGSHREATLLSFERCGVTRERIDFVGLSPRQEYFKMFQRVDVCLDTLPYNGHTTSLDSFWMGVPVVSLAGDTVAGRAGVSQLMNLRLPELIARSPAEFTAIAARLVEDAGRLREMRRTLRTRMEHSPLMNAAAFARDIEAAYSAMWRLWCQSGDRESPS